MANYEMEFSTPSSISADKVTFNPSGTNLKSTDTEGAIKEVNSNIGGGETVRYELANNGSITVESNYALKIMYITVNLNSQPCPEMWTELCQTNYKSDSWPMAMVYDTNHYTPLLVQLTDTGKLRVGIYNSAYLGNTSARGGCSLKFQERV